VNNWSLEVIVDRVVGEKKAAVRVHCGKELRDDGTLIGERCLPAHLIAYERHQ